MRRRISTSRRAGWLVAEALVGLFILATMGGLLAVTWHQEQVTLLRLADNRAAARVAEEVLIDLQTHQVPPPSEGESMRWSLLPTLSVSTTQAWVEVTAQVGKSRCVLTGLVPQDAIHTTGDAR